MLLEEITHALQQPTLPPSRKFYFDCSNLRYLTSLITVPKLPQVNIAT